MHEPPWPSSAAIVPLRAEPLNSSPPLPTDSTAALLAAAAAVAVGSCGAGVFVGRGARVALAPLVGVGGAGVTVGAIVGEGAAACVCATLLCWMPMTAVVVCMLASPTRAANACWVAAMIVWVAPAACRISIVGTGVPVGGSGALVAASATAGVTVGWDAWPNPPVANAAAAPSTSTTGTPISAQRHLLRGVVSS